ncbi:hypothetical protein O23A_p0361 [Aeromonas salmonicida]|nr:hypothetical protein O23A_p0361 [Aeromonas salmonicida]
MPVPLRHIYLSIWRDKYHQNQRTSGYSSAIKNIVYAIY